MRIFVCWFCMFGGFSRYQSFHRRQNLCTSVHYKPTDSHSYLLYSHPLHKEFHSLFLDFVVYAMMTLIFPTNQRKCASSSKNVAILLLLFKRAITAPNKLIDSQHYKRHRRKRTIEFHSRTHSMLTITRLNPSFLKTLNYFKMIPKLVESFRYLHSFHSNATKK